jgi:hypothetical protein
LSASEENSMRGKAAYLLLFAGLLIGLSCAPGERKAKVDVDKEDASPPPIVLPRELKPRLEAALENVHARDMETTFSFWTIFHGILGMGFDTTLLERDTGKKVNAIDHIRQGKPVRGLKFLVNPEGIDVRIGPVPEGQGHQDQFVAEMAQWGMKADATFVINGKTYTFLDFARFSKARASARPRPHPDDTVKKQELGWAILVIAEYYGPDVAPWTTMYGDGEKVSLQDLVRAELEIDMPKAACGGTHSLFGLTWVYFRHLEKGGKTQGVWADVAAHLKKYADQARRFQNADGSFSSEYVNGAGETKDPDRRINTTGHVIEWLALYLPDDELKAPWMQDAVMAQCKMILDHSYDDIDGGSLYHATHGLHIYYDRVFDRPNSKKGQPVLPLRPR